MAEPYTMAKTTATTPAITISAELRPYVDMWYDELKRENETLDQFLLRKLKEEAMVHRLKRCNDVCSQEHNVARDVELEQQRTDYGTEINSI